MSSKQKTVSSPFVSAEGVDLYESSSALYYFLQFAVWIYVLAYVAHMVLILNTSVTHTYFKTLPGGTLFSERYATARWIFLMLGALRILVPIAVLSIILYRLHTNCMLWWIFVLALLVITDTLVLISLGTDFGDCNGQNQFGNLCNSVTPPWCCAPSIFGNPGNMCPNSAGCTPAVTVADLAPNSNFLWLFYATVGFVVLDLILLLLPIGLWVGRPIGTVPRASGALYEPPLFSYSEGALLSEQQPQGRARKRKSSPSRKRGVPMPRRLQALRVPAPGGAARLGKIDHQPPTRATD